MYDYHPCQLGDIDRQAPHTEAIWDERQRLQGGLDEAQDTLGKHDYKTYTEAQHEQGDTLRSLLPCLVNREKGGNAVVSIRDVNRTTLTAQEDILRHSSEFYSTLYVQQDLGDTKSISRVLDEVPLPTADGNVRAVLNAPLDEKDSRRAIKQMNTEKVPGNNKLSVEFYQECVEFSCTPLLAMCNEEFETVVLPASLKEANTMGLSKPRRNPTDSDHC
ncbi:hypothetical protein NDU88_003541 [Pleurodeles waltl]|uniref:Uncharacterized protein n=1 Tax=Pleurodeles waltl TaxID=8319 RepID=A0AAV7V2Q0_PLEWA|nr:hypothetical protein NDU88_003541 [Pleurodeles waltl]